MLAACALQRRDAPESTSPDAATQPDGGGNHEASDGSGSSQGGVRRDGGALPDRGDANTGAGDAAGRDAARDDAGPTGDGDAGDTEAPETTLEQAPAQITANPDARFVFSADEPGDFECSLDNAAFAACASPLTHRGLALGSHGFAVRAIDLAGNVDPTPARHSWEVSEGPETLLRYGPPPETPLTSVRVVVASHDSPVTFVCSADGATAGICPADIRLSDLAAGPHELSVAARDSEGRIDPTPLIVHWEVLEGVATPMAQVATGYRHACAVAEDGALYCWGHNAFGQLGRGDDLARARPARVGEDNDWRQVTAGRFHSCGLRAEALFCWGHNAFGQSAGPTPEPLAQPTPVAPGVGFQQVDAGEWHTCAVSSAGALYCFGYNLYGRLGDGSGLGDADSPADSVTTPTEIDPGVGYAAVTAGTSHTCAVRDDDRSLHCFGLNDRGQLGRDSADMCEAGGSSLPCALTPGAIPELSVSVSGWGVGASAGTAHSCAVDSARLARCWGSGRRGRLGLGDESDALAPAALGLPLATLSAGGSHSCGVDPAGRLLCWGDNSNGQLGLGELHGSGALAPTPVGVEGEWFEVSAGQLGTCATTTAGALFCWGLADYADSLEPRYLIPL